MAPWRRSLAALLPAAAAAGAACFAVAPLPSSGVLAARAAAALGGSASGGPAASAAVSPAALAAASSGGVLLVALAAASKARRRGGALAGGCQASARGARATACRANPTAVFETTMGTFKAELFLDKMPITCSNFIDLCKTGFYDGIHFHRVIPNFMNQFGCPNAKNPRSPRAGTGGPADGTSFEVLDGTGKVIKRLPGGNIPDELITKITNGPGTLSMANTGQPNSGGSQFFINVASNDYLDWFDRRSPSAHPVFGEITEGYDLVEKISRVRTVQDAPVEPIMMKTITIEGL